MIGLSGLSVGSELASLEREDTEWRALIRAIRAKYAGPLVYSANWDHLDDVQFWDALDLAGASAYFELPLPDDVASLTLNPGIQHIVVQEWDKCGGAATTPVVVTVGSGGPSGQFVNLHQKSGWTGYGLLPPVYDICPSCVASGPQVTWSMTQGVSSPSQTGNSARMDIGGQTIYADGLWNNHLIGDFSSRGP
jgi:hypothetical protein